MNEQLQSSEPAVPPPFEPVLVERMTVETRPVAPVAVVRKGRRGWLAPVAIGAIGVIAGGVLGSLLYVNTGQRDLARKQLAATSATLAGNRAELAAAQADAAARAVTATYVTTYVIDSGRADTAIQAFYSSCGSSQKYSVCRDGAQQALTALQAFQADRTSIAVPSPLSASDSMLKDSLSAAIAAMQEIITGGDDNNSSQLDDGFNKLSAAQLSLAKAEASLGTALK